MTSVSIHSLVFSVNAIAFLCIQLVTSADLGAGLWKYFTGSTLIAYFTMKSHRKDVSKGLNHILIIFIEKFFACPPPFKLLSAKNFRLGVILEYCLHII